MSLDSIALSIDKFESGAIMAATFSLENFEQWAPVLAGAAPDIKAITLLNCKARLRHVDFDSALQALSIREVKLAKQELGNEDVVPFWNSKFASQLECLDLSFNDLTDLPCEPTFLSLRSLNLSHNRLELGNVWSLFDRLNCPALRSLNLSYNGLEDISVEKISETCWAGIIQTETFGQLDELDVSGNEVDYLNLNLFRQDGWIFMGDDGWHYSSDRRSEPVAIPKRIIWKDAGEDPDELTREVYLKEFSKPG